MTDESNRQNREAETIAEESLSLKETIVILLKSSRAFWQVNIINFGDGIAYFGILTLLTLFISNRVGFSDNMTHISVSFFMGMVTLFMLFGGFISDRFGVRHAFTISLLLLAVGRAMLVGSPGMGSAAGVMLWSSLLVMAFAEGIIQPALYAGVKEYTDPRTATIGYSVLYAIMNLGIFAETFISPFIREKSGMEGVYWVMVIFTVSLLAVNVLGFTRKIEERDRVVKPESCTGRESRPLWEKMKELPFLNARFLFFIFILLPVRTLFAHQWLTLPQYMERCYSPAVFARYEWFQAINPLIIVIFVPLFAALTRNVRVITMMIIGTAVSAMTTFILVPGPNLSALIFYVVIFSLGEALWSSRFLEYVADLAPAGKVGAYMGLAGIPWFLAKMTTGLYSGRMLEHFVPANGPVNSEMMWLIYALIACISPIGLILGAKWVNKGVPQKS